MKSLTFPAVALTSTLLLVACATPGDAPYREEEEPTVEAAGLQDERPDRPGLADELYGPGGQEARELRLQQLAEALERSERPRATQQRESVMDGRPASRVGLLLNEHTDARLEDSLRALAADYPLRLLDDSATRDAMEAENCGEPVDCARALRAYPGLRLVLEIDTDPDDPRMVTTRFHDLEMETSSRPRRLAVPDGDDGIPEQALDSLADQLLMAASDMIGSMPWTARVFQTEADDWLINAGGADGLGEGDRLLVIREGRMLRNALGEPAGYASGRNVGTVEVRRIAGDHVAVVEPVDGQAPGSGDVLMLLR
ncbi:MAG: hypothetical protein JJU06_10325 [Ectothiorhodospiraceae bacterium]|nr:hypothetical protein [Ectothiorhodospiraceae bacterium]MCH8503051.1 hypothetical protein [Ectothiorhodospiraceae bacterium]